MAIAFNADEVFEIAEQIERNGARFYRKAAEKVKAENFQQLLLKLADWELSHEKLFAEMRKKLSAGEKAETVYDPDNEGVLYLRALAEGRIFDLRSDPSRKLTKSVSMEKILSIAIEAERNSVLYYTGMKEVVPEKLGKARIEAIIKEEMNHITILNGHLEALGH